jgi:hypothetical protein
MSSGGNKMAKFRIVCIAGILFAGSALACGACQHPCSRIIMPQNFTAEKMVVFGKETVKFYVSRQALT